MRKKISFFIVNGNGKPTRQISAPSIFFRVAMLLGACGLVFLVFAGYNYFQLNNKLAFKQDLERQVLNQRDVIANQREQIQHFAAQINVLKTKLLSINAFEQKIRVLANLEKTTDNDSFFGIGGSIPEDLAAQLPLEKKHNSLMRDMHAQVDKLNNAGEIQSQNFETLLKALDDQVNLLASTPAIRPLKGGWVSSDFGYRTSPFTGLREFHKGLDIASRAKSPIIATADGTVTFIGKKGFLGKVIIIDHGHGIVTRYGHIHKAMKKNGQKVKRGDIIALVGSTGRTTGPHLHYEVMLNGVKVNPLKYILN